LNELQDTPMTNFNDLPTKGYDFYAPLGEYGQVRPHYHLLRRLHLLTRDFGDQLAAMPATLPELRPAGRNDFATLRWAVRSDGRSGFVFASNHHRSHPLAAQAGVQFHIKLPAGEIVFPTTPLTIPADARFVWPFNLDLGHGVTLVHATAQLLCRIDEGDVRTVFFAATPGIAAEFAVSTAGQPAKGHTLQSGHGVALEVTGRTGRVQIVLLDDADSLALWKGGCFGRDRVVLSRAGVVFDAGRLRLTAEEVADLAVSIFPTPVTLAADQTRLAAQNDGIFARFLPPAPAAAGGVAKVASLRPAGPAREIPLGKIATPVAVAPGDTDFAAAAVWQVSLPAGWEKADPILRIHYRGDVARVQISDQFITDNFYDGRPFEIGLRRHAAELTKGALRVSVLPLRADAPIFLPAGARLKPADSPVAALDRVELIPRHTVELSAAP